MARRILNRGLIVTIMLLVCGIAASLLQADRQAGILDEAALKAAATGGPDSFGYTFADSTTASCSYSFVDISGSGTVVPLGDDFTAGPLALSAPFNFYGTDYSDLYMSSNGFLSTEDDFGDDVTNDCPLPAVPSDGTGGRMYVLHDDLVLKDGFHQYFASCPRAADTPPGTEACTIFQWDDTLHFGGSGSFDMQAILYHDTCELVFQVAAGNPEQGVMSTTGIQDPVASSGLTYACNTASSIPNHTAVCFFGPAIPQCGGIFRDGFETGGTTAWSSVTP